MREPKGADRGRRGPNAPDLDLLAASAGREPDLVEAVHRLTDRLGVTPAELETELERLEAGHGCSAYSELIFLLCHLRLDAGEAKRCWQRVVAHHGSLQQRLGSFVDLRVALASYFLQVDRKLENPKLIELRLFEETQASAHLDALTGLYNFRFFREFLLCQLGRAARSRDPLSVVMIDVDDFKPYNDQNGHEAGNLALQDIARLLKESVHESDVAARYGGEEFALILPATPKQGAEVVAERVRAKIELHEFRGEEAQPSGALTVSVGVATAPGDARDASELVRSADQAMYGSKAAGKNRVQLHGGSLRSYRRVEARVPGSLLRIGRTPAPVTCVNLSEGGLSFVTDQPIEPGTLIEMTLQLPGSHGSVSVTCRVVRPTPDGSGGYLVGSRVLDMKPDDQRRLNHYLDGLGGSASGGA